MSEINSEDFTHASGRLPRRLYISKAFSYPGKTTIHRNAWKRLEEGPLKQLVKDGDEFVLHETDTGIQQIKARFIEDGRGITHLHIQRWSTKTNTPIGEQVILYGQQITRLIEFLSNIRRLEIPSSEKFTVDESDLRLVHLPEAETRRVLEEHPELVAEFARSKLTTEDVVALAYRREQLSVYSEMLDRGQNISEGSWQEFFERNQWIFGYGLSYVFTTGLDGQRLQQTLRGSSLVSPGKIPDGVMKTRAAVSALCLVEIKKSSTDLLKNSEYRKGAWAPSNELSGAVAQCQETLRAAVDVLDTHHRFEDEQGNPIGEELMSVQPRSFLIVGSLTEFQAERGVNSKRYQSFEGFRRNLRQPEILTFDELYERARFIVEHSEHSDSPSEFMDEEIPF